MSKGFNLADVLGEAAKLDTGIDGREQIEYIDIDLIDPDPDNFYELSDIDGLAANIELVGLQQPLRVRENPFDSSRYIVVSGHRRREALKLLVGEGKETYRHVACIREAEVKSPALRELRLIYANSDTRTMTSAEISKQAERVEALLYQLKEEGVEFPGRMRDHVADACKVSKSKLSRLKVIAEKLENPFAEQFQRGELTEQAAYAIARLPMDIQWKLGEAVPKKIISGITAENILSEFGNGHPEKKCPKGGECYNCVGKLKYSATSQYAYQYCSPDDCCLECSNRRSCKGACKEANQLNAEDKTKELAEREKAAHREDIRREEANAKAMANAQRLVRAIDAAGVGDATVINFGYYNIPVAKIRKISAGEFDRTKYESECQFFYPSALRDAAKLFNCSADYLLGLTDELRPTSEPAPAEALSWNSGLPPKTGYYAAVFNCDGYKMQKLTWFNTCLGKFYFDKSCGHSIEAECVGWYPIPQDDE